MPFNDAEAIVTFGKIVSYSTTANGTFVTIFGTTDVTPPEREIGKAEYTNDNSPNRTKQYKAALAEPGAAKFSYKYQTTQFAVLDALFIAGTMLYFKIQTPDLKVRNFQGFMTKHNEGELGLDDVPDIDVEIQANGPVTITTGTAPTT